MVKTIMLRQEPPFYKETGGLFTYHLPPPTEIIVSCWYIPHSTAVKTEKKI